MHEGESRLVIFGRSLRRVGRLSRIEFGGVPLAVTEARRIDLKCPHFQISAYEGMDWVANLLRGRTMPAARLRLCTPREA